MQIGKIIEDLSLQIDAGQLIIPIMESRNHNITDSLAFIIAFNDMTRAPHISKEANTWDYFNSTGTISEFPDQELLELLQTYYFAPLLVFSTKSDLRNKLLVENTNNGINSYLKVIKKETIDKSTFKEQG